VKVDGLPEQIGPLDWIRVIDRRTGERLALSGQKEAGIIVKQGIPDPPPKVTMITYSVGSDEELMELQRLVKEAQAAWDRAHGL
jgi:hypothetical protein